MSSDRVFWKEYTMTRRGEPVGKQLHQGRDGGSITGRKGHPHAVLQERSPRASDGLVGSAQERGVGHRVQVFRSEQVGLHGPGWKWGGRNGGQA